MTTLTLRRLAGLALLTAVAACGNTKGDGPSPLGMARGIIGSAAGGGKAAPPAAPAAIDPGRILQLNPGPVIVAGFESSGTTQVMAMDGENGGTRTYMTSNSQALIFRGGMLVGTRGLGHDLSVAEVSPSAALIHAGQSGRAQRVMRYFSGDGKERPLNLDCTVGPGPKPGVIVEDCIGRSVRFQNSYLRGPGGFAVSRQWVSPALGYVTIQTLRP